jgi:hypothetical protein
LIHEGSFNGRGDENIKKIVIGSRLTTFLTLTATRPVRIILGSDFLFILLLVILAIYAAYYFIVRRGSLEDFGWRTTWWLVPYFGGMWLLSALSPTGLGGNDTLSLVGAMIAVAVFSLAIMTLALKTSMTDEKVRAVAAEIAALTP